MSLTHSWMLSLWLVPCLLLHAFYIISGFCFFLVCLFFCYISTPSLKLTTVIKHTFTCASEGAPFVLLVFTQDPVAATSAVQRRGSRGPLLLATEVATTKQPACSTRQGRLRHGHDNSRAESSPVLFRKMCTELRTKHGLPSWEGVTFGGRGFGWVGACKQGGKRITMVIFF